MKFETEIGRGNRVGVGNPKLGERQILSCLSAAFPTRVASVFTSLWLGYAPRSAGPNIGERRQARQVAALLSSIGTRRDIILFCPAIMSLSSKESFLLVSCLLAMTMLAVTCAKPTIYKRNQDNVFEPGEPFAFPSVVARARNLQNHFVTRN